MKYTLCPDAVLISVLEESMLMLVDSRANQIRDMREVNQAGLYIWRLLEKGTALDDVVSGAARDYGISEDAARASVEGFIEELRSAGYIIMEL